MKAPEYDEKLAAEYNADFDRVAFAVNRLLREIPDFRNILHIEVGKMFDGDYNVLISQLLKNYNPVVEWFWQCEVGIQGIVEKYPLIQIAIPVNYEKWDDEKMLPVVYFPYGYQINSEENLWGYDTKGDKKEFTKNEFLKEIFVVVCEKESIIYVDDVNVQIAESFAVGFYTELENSPNDVTVILVDSILDWDGNTAMYFFNFAEGGYVITSASVRNEPIIGYSQEGCFAPIKEEDTPEALIFMLTETMVFNRWIQKGEEDKILQGIIQNNIGTWFKELRRFKMANEFRLDERIIIPYDPCDHALRTLVGVRYENTVDYLCKTTWNQGKPYNFYIPNNYWVGCAPVAMAQILRCYEKPNNFSWSIMPNAATTSIYANMTAGDKEIAKLMYNVANNTNTTFGENGSNTTLVMAWWAFKYKYDYSCSDIRSYKYDRMKSDIKNKKQPVLVNGQGNIGGTKKDGHFFVADGYQEIIKTFTYNCMGNQVTYDDRKWELIHYNFGWGGSYDGWYSNVLRDIPNTDLDYDEIMHKEFPNFKHSKYCLYNIKPK